MLLTEEEMFAEVESSTYLTALYSIINQVRYQRQPFCALKTLLEGEQASEATLMALCVLNPSKAGYTVDYNRFIAEITPKVGGPQPSIHSRRH